MSLVQHSLCPLPGRRLGSELLHNSEVVRVISAYFLIYAFNPTITGFPSIIAVVVWLPWLEATTRVLPLADGVGVCISTVIINSFPLISTFILSYFLPVSGHKNLVLFVIFSRFHNFIFTYFIGQPPWAAKVYSSFFLLPRSLARFISSKIERCDS